MSTYQEGAAGQSAARLFSQVIYEAAQLDVYRRRLAGDDPVLADLLLGIEEEALRQMQGLVQNLLVRDGVAVQERPPKPAGTRHRLKNSIRRFVQWKRHRGLRAQRDADTSAVDGEPDIPSGPVVKGEVLE